MARDGNHSPRGSVAGTPAQSAAQGGYTLCEWIGPGELAEIRGGRRVIHHFSTVGAPLNEESPAGRLLAGLSKL